MSRSSPRDRGSRQLNAVRTTHAAPGLSQDMLALWGFGLLLAGFEWISVLGWGRRLFLSSAELFSYALAAGLTIPGLVMLLGLLLRLASRADRLGLRARIGVALASIAGGAWVGWALTAGRRVKDLSVRPWLVLGFAVLVGLLAVLGMRTATLVRAKGAEKPGLAWSGFCGVGALIALCLDALVLPRGYPAFHLLMFVVALAFAALGAVGLPTSMLPSRPRLAMGLAVLSLLGAPLSMASLARQANTSFAVMEAAPFTAKLLAPWLAAYGPKRRSEMRSTLAVSEPGSAAQPGINLQDKDILLITVDALRADLLAPYGGTGAAPVLDRLAKESVVFLRAYTPAPHTSYALASLLTSKFMKPVLELPGAERDHPTLPDLLRRYGYRTAAFYPPAIFFVDGSSFDTLRERGFGFEYRKEMFAKGPERVRQVEAYLKEVEPNHPLFLWVHLFEPHEPYEPPPDMARGDSPRARYEGEVRAADRSIGELVRVFRGERPQGTVIVTADHGEEFGEHGGSYHGTTLYDEQVRVPLLWSSPGQTQPLVSEVPVELVDIGTTLLSAAGVPREARMRGDDLGAVLAGHVEAGPHLAFASVEHRQMATDGRVKVVCATNEPHCQAFDLRTDPAELRNVASERPAEVERMRSEIDRFVSTIPRAEALAMAQGVGLPEALARAKLGVTGVAPELIPLLGDTRIPVRAAAARALGELQHQPALPMLDRLRVSDPSPSVRSEAAISVLELGHEQAIESVLALLEHPSSHEATPEERALVRRAALVLSRRARTEALPALSELASDPSAPEEERVSAVRALGASAAPQVLNTLIPLLGDVRLREEVANALGQVGGQRARNALAKQLLQERYEPARRAEALALVKLRDKRAVPLILRYLGTESSLPEGVRLLMQLGVLGAKSRVGSVLTDPSRRLGEWGCDDAEGCAPKDGAALVLPPSASPQSEVRLTWLVTAKTNDASLLVDDQSLPLRSGEQQVSVLRTQREAMRVRVAVSGPASVVAVVSAKAQAEIPPPEAEPWDAGVPEDAGESAPTRQSP